MTSLTADSIDLRSLRSMPGDAAWAARGAGASVSSTAVVLPSRAVAGDTLIVATAAVIVATGETLYQAANGKFSSDRMRETWKPVMQSAGSVPIWDLAQRVGYAITTGAAKGLAASSLLVGLCAGPASCIIGHLYDIATDEITREMWSRRPSLMGKKFLKDLLLSATVGAIPNAVWNVVFVLSLFALLSAGCPPLAAVLLTAALVAGIVAFTNVQFGKKAMEVVDACINDQIKKIWDVDLQQEVDELRRLIEDAKN